MSCLISCNQFAQDILTGGNYEPPKREKKKVARRLQMCLYSQREGERESTGKRDIIHSEGQNRIRDEARRSEMATRFLEVNLKCEGSSLSHTAETFFFLCFAKEPEPCRLAYFKFVLCNERSLKNKQLSKMFHRLTYFKLIIRVIFNFLKEMGHPMCGKRIKTTAVTCGSRIT